MAALSPPADATLMSVRISVAAITAVGLLVALPSIILLQSSPRAAPSAEWERPAPCMSRRWDSKLSSENLQDVVLRDVFFPSLCAGTALEMGANDGRVGSPTLNFGRSGWRTVLIEADPIVFHTLRANRPPPEITINAVVSDEARTETWVRFDNRYLSGIKRFLNMEKLKPMLADGRLKVLDELPLEGLPLQTLLAQHGVPHVDLFSLDVEGAELSVLRTLPWAAASPSFGVFMIENGNATDIREFLASQGVEYVGSLLWDAFFVSRGYLRQTSLRRLRRRFRQRASEPQLRDRLCKCLAKVASLSRMGRDACRSFCK